MASRARTARDRLQEQQRRADTLILERLPDALIVLREDPRRSVGGTRRRKRFSARICRRRCCGILELLRGYAALDLAVTDGETKAADLSIAGPIARELRATVIPIDPPPGDGGRAVVLLSDRTRERSAERSHADFVANVSHELRTPLASLIGFTETLLGPAEDDPPARKRFLHIMAEQGARMNRLIDDLPGLSVADRDDRASATVGYRRPRRVAAADRGGVRTEVDRRRGADRGRDRAGDAADRWRRGPDCPGDAEFTG